MTTNPLSARRAPQESGDWKPPHELVQDLNDGDIGRYYGWFWFLLDGVIYKIDLPKGAKGWLRENEKRAKASLRKVIGDEPHIVDQAYRMAIDYATSAKAWSNLERR
jgi:hypothetical protein